MIGTSLVVRWLRLWTASAWGMGSIHGRGLESRVPHRQRKGKANDRKAYTVKSRAFTSFLQSPHLNIFISFWTVTILCAWNSPGKNLLEWVAISYSN